MTEQLADWPWEGVTESGLRREGILVNATTAEMRGMVRGFYLSGMQSMTVRDEAGTEVAGIREAQGEERAEAFRQELKHAARLAAGNPDTETAIAAVLATLMDLSDAAGISWAAVTAAARASRTAHGPYRPTVAWHRDV